MVFEQEDVKYLVLQGEVFDYKPVQGRLAPIITTGIKLGEVWYPIGIYVDSGAAYTLLHAAIAQGAGLVIEENYDLHTIEIPPMHQGSHNCIIFLRPTCHA